MEVKLGMIINKMEMKQFKSEPSNEFIKMEETFFDCDDCGSMFKTEIDLYEHKKSHSIQVFECNSCDFTSSVGQSLEEHILSHHVEQIDIPEGESIADFFFNHHIKMEPEHSETLSLEPIKVPEIPPVQKIYDYFFCKLCQKEYTSKRNLHSHITRVHEKNLSRFECPHCHRKFFKKFQLDSHLETPLTGGFNCTFCDFKSKCKPNMTNHFVKEHKATCRFPCEKCGEKFETMDYLHSHMQEKHKRLPRRFECDFCGRKYGKKSTLVTHMEDHYATTLLMCDHCDYKHINKVYLTSHINRRHMIKHNIPCEYCGKKFKMKADVKRHVDLVHKEHPPAICGICGHLSKNEILLKSHVTSAHPSEAIQEKFHCRYCGKIYSRKRIFDNHIRKHTGEKPFSCPVCRKDFRDGGVMRNHILLHMEKKLFKCNICGDSFAQKCQLRKHRTKHPGPLSPLPVIKIKEIINEFLEQFSAQQSS